MSDKVEDDLVVELSDPDLSLELEQLKLEYQKIQCKQRMLQLKQTDKKVVSQSSSMNRCVLPGGRVMVANNRATTENGRDLDNSFGAGAGDSLQPKIPALQRHGSRACVNCGHTAEMYCGGCQLTPYCGVTCQKRDWVTRHRSVCHNLARSDGTEHQDSTEMPSAVPLRQPNSSSNGYQKDPVVDTFKKPIRPGYTPPVNANNVHRNNRPAGNRGKAQPRSQDKKPVLTKNNSEEDWGSPVNQNSKIEHGGQKKVKNQNAEPVQNQEDKKDSEATPAASTCPKPKQPEIPSPKPQADPPVTKFASVKNVTPEKKIVPKTCVLDVLSEKEKVIVSIESEYKSTFVCLCLNERVHGDYGLLCEEYCAECERDSNMYKPKLGETFSYLNPEDAAYYRARCLDNGSAALLDMGKVVDINGATMKKLPVKYEAIPEFCVVLHAAGVKIGSNLECTLVAKTPRGYQVTMHQVGSGVLIGDGELTRWTPDVVSVPPAVNGSLIPEIHRPDVTNNSKVILIDTTSLDKVFVCPAGIEQLKRYESIFYDVELYIRNAKPLTSPPTQGQLVIGKFTDGHHYRALCKRTNVKLNKYLLEYIEYGNMEISCLENLYPCPPQLDLHCEPTLVSQVVLVDDKASLTAAAKEYVEKLKNDQTELMLTIPSGDKSAPSGSHVTLTVVKTNDKLNRTLKEMCTPEWKKMEERGADVIEMPPLMFSALQYLDLPACGCEIEVLDFSTLQEGTIAGYQAGSEYANKVFTTLTEQMAKYCESELGKEPYLPRFEELCIAKCPPYDQWFRAVLCEQETGPGGENLKLCYVDYGNVESVSSKLVRKMLPEFIKIPALATHLEISDFPINLTQEKLAKALEYLQINEEGKGKLKVTRCVKQDPGFYVVDAPGLIQAIEG